MTYKIDRLYSYIVSHDTGFSPNPFWGMCTLACCKPRIRQSVLKHLQDNPDEHNWIIGLSPKNYELGNDIIYIMQVDGAMTFPDYFEKHPEKRPDYSRSDIVQRCGDNIYQPLNNGSFNQLRSTHSEHPQDDIQWSPNLENMERDVSGKCVLCSKRFIYFGSEAIPLPPELFPLKIGRAHRCNFDRSVLDAFGRFVGQFEKQLEKGVVLGKPHRWSDTDKSWIQ
jgi:hypothetical protein